MPTRRRLKWGAFTVDGRPGGGDHPLHGRAFHDHELSSFAWKAAPKNIIAFAKRDHQTLQTIHWVGSVAASATGFQDHDRDLCGSRAVPRLSGS